MPYDVASGLIEYLLRNADPRRKARNKSKLQPVAVSAAKEAAAAEELLAKLENEGHAVKLSNSKKTKQRAKERKAM